MKTYHPIAVANYFLLLAREDGGRLGRVSQMKLQKLVYIAHGWHLAITGRPLINERVEAWQYGPVIPSLYRAARAYGSGPILRELEMNEWEEYDLAIIEDDPEAQSVIEKVWEVYKQYSAAELSAMTHKKGSPWHEAWVERNGQYIRGTDIDETTMRRHFAELGLRKRRIIAGE